jgi:hypothetical protein
MPVKELSDKNPDGTRLGQAAADLVSYYGLTPVSQRASSVQATSLLSSSVDFTTAHLVALQEIMNTMTALGLWKGAA